MKTSPPSNSLPVVVFDLYGTLVDVGSVAPACEKCFPGRGAALSRLWRDKQLEYTWLLNSMGEYLDFWEVSLRALRYSCAKLGLTTDSETEQDVMSALLALTPFEDAAPTIARLADRGITMAVLSNGTEFMVRKALEGAGFAQEVADIMSVDSVQVYKPDPRVYAMATDSFADSSEGIVFVSGNGWDAAGAATAGLQTIWVNRSGNPPEAVGATGLKVIPSLRDLYNALIPNDD